MTADTIIEAAVKSAFSVEYAATIVDANAQKKQKKWQLSPEQVEELKTPAALYAKALGMQSLTSRIEQYIRDTATRCEGVRRPPPDQGDVARPNALRTMFSPSGNLIASGEDEVLAIRFRVQR
jgi:hypothetical protein